MNNAKRLYIFSTLILLMGIAYYFVKNVQNAGDTQIYTGLYSYGFEWSLFVSCTELPVKSEYIRDLHFADIDFIGENKFFKEYQSYFENHQPVFIKVRGQLSPLRNDWMGLNNTIIVHEVLEVKQEREKECTPPESYSPPPPPTFATQDDASSETSNTEPANTAELELPETLNAEPEDAPNIEAHSN